MRIDHFIHDSDMTEKIFHMLGRVLANQEKIMATLDEVLAKVTEESTVDDSIIALLNGIAQQLKDVLSGTVIPPAVQTKLDAIFSTASASVTKVSDAVTANTPAAPGA